MTTVDICALAPPSPRRALVRRNLSRLDTALLVAALGLAAPAVAQEGEGPGAFDVDLEAAERALERTLTLRGQLLLPFGQFEIEPFIGYEHSDRAAGFAFTFVDGDRVVESLRAQEDRVTAALDARIGLPFDSQFELRVPFVYLNQQVDRGISGTSADESTTGLGDIRVGFAKTLVRENGAIPDIVGRIAWDTASGSDSDTLDLSTGYQEFTGALSFVRRIDPLALTGGLSYQTTLERDDVKPGDVFGFNLGTTLAASPTTALSFGFSTAIRQDTEVNDVTIDGSNLNEAYISFGISSVVRRNALLSLTFGTGLTDDSTDYFISASLPIRFTAW